MGGKISINAGKSEILDPLPIRAPSYCMFVINCVILWLFHTIMSGNPRVRFAPSPTGPLHIGGLRTALYNYLFAKKQGGVFILRIEDTDQTRYVEGAEAYITAALNWCGLEYQEGPDKGGEYGPYRQSERSGLYREYAADLVASGHAYYAFDTPEALENKRADMKAKGIPAWQYDHRTRGEMDNSLTLPDDEVQRRLAAGEPHVIRIKVNPDEEITIQDQIRGEVKVMSKELDDKVLMKADGLPTYHMANVVDDRLMRITHVIRGEEWLPSTPIHVLLYKYLGWGDEMPEFAHLPLILRPDGKGKLSKRDGDKMGFPVFPMDWTDPGSGELWPGFRETGFYPEAFVNMLVFLGWNPGTEQELFTLPELVEAFEVDRVGKAGARFDYEKATWFNEQYLRDHSDDELAGQLSEWLSVQQVAAGSTDLAAVCRLMKERVSFIREIYESAMYFFETPATYDDKTVRKKWKGRSTQMITELLTVFEGLEDYDPDSLEAAFKQYVEKGGYGFGAALVSLRLVITGVGGGPPLFDIIAIIGKSETLARMKKGLGSLPRTETVY